MFKFQASDPNGASNVAAIYGIFSVGGNDTDGSNGPGQVTTYPPTPDQGLCNFAYDSVNNLIYLGDGSGGWLGPSVVGSGGTDLSTRDGCVIHGGSSTSWRSLGGPQAQATPETYVYDLTLDVTLPASPSNKYHLYGYAENASYDFDACGLKNLPGDPNYDPNKPACPTWKYWGYWWNGQ